MFTIGVPGFLLSQLPNTDLIKGSFTYNILSRAVPGGITDMIIVALMMMIGTIFNLPSEEISTAATVLLAVVGMQMVYRASKPMNRIKWGIFFLMIIGLILSGIFLPWLFGISPLSIQTIIICAGLSFASFPILQKLTELTDRFGMRIQRLIHKYSRRVRSLLKEMWADR
jgi:cation-transporting ATPase E